MSRFIQDAYLSFATNVTNIKVRRGVNHVREKYNIAFDKVMANYLFCDKQNRFIASVSIQNELVSNVLQLSDTTTHLIKQLANNKELVWNSVLSPQYITLAFMIRYVNDPSFKFTDRERKSYSFILIRALMIISYSSRIGVFFPYGCQSKVVGIMLDSHLRRNSYFKQTNGNISATISRSVENRQDNYVAMMMKGKNADLDKNYADMLVAIRTTVTKLIKVLKDNYGLASEKREDLLIDKDVVNDKGETLDVKMTDTSVINGAVTSITKTSMLMFADDTNPLYKAINSKFGFADADSKEIAQLIWLSIIYDTEATSAMITGFVQYAVREGSPLLCGNFDSIMDAYKKFSNSSRENINKYLFNFVENVIGDDRRVTNKVKLKLNKMTFVILSALYRKGSC